MKTQKKKENPGRKKNEKKLTSFLHHSFILRKDSKRLHFRLMMIQPPRAGKYAPYGILSDGKVLKISQKSVKISL